MRANNSLAQLIFSTAAVRSLKRFGNGIQIRIDNNKLCLKATNRQRLTSDVLPLVRRPSGTQINLVIGAELSEQVLQTIDLLGYTPEQPYFLLKPMARHWLDVQHVELIEAPTGKEEYLQVIRSEPRMASTQIAVLRVAIEQAGQSLALLNPVELREVLPSALILAQTIARLQDKFHADGLPASLRKFLSDETLVSLDGAEFDRRVSMWAQEADGAQPLRVSIEDVKRAISPNRPESENYLSDEEAHRIIAQFMEG